MYSFTVTETSQNVFPGSIKMHVGGSQKQRRIQARQEKEARARSTTVPKDGSTFSSASTSSDTSTSSSSSGSSNSSAGSDAAQSLAPSKSPKPKFLPARVFSLSVTSKDTKAHKHPAKKGSNDAMKESPSVMNKAVSTSEKKTAPITTKPTPIASLEAATQTGFRVNNRLDETIPQNQDHHAHVKKPATHTRSPMKAIDKTEPKKSPSPDRNSVKRPHGLRDTTVEKPKKERVKTQVVEEIDEDGNWDRKVEVGEDGTERSPSSPKSSRSALGKTLVDSNPFAALGDDTSASTVSRKPSKQQPKITKKRNSKQTTVANIEQVKQQTAPVPASGKKTMPPQGVKAPKAASATAQRTRQPLQQSHLARYLRQFAPLTDKSTTEAPVPPEVVIKVNEFPGLPPPRPEVFSKISLRLQEEAWKAAAANAAAQVSKTSGMRSPEDLATGVSSTDETSSGPRFIAQKLDNFLAMSPTEREWLVEGPTINIELGKMVVHDVPKRFAMAVSPPINSYFTRYPYAPVYKIYERDVEANAVFTLLRDWPEEVTKAKYFQTPQPWRFNDLVKDLAVLRAAKVLGMDKYTVVTSNAYWNYLRYQLPTYEDIATLEKGAASSKQYDHYYRSLVNNLAHQRHQRKIRDVGDFKKFLAEHPKLKADIAAVDKVNAERNRAKRQHQPKKLAGKDQVIVLG
ncbi:hypothetical protein BDV96DRAFT_632539 [Lophiotrema nucula]|uniref:Uncharacterized protein n=1 Tax=Lophiotrema nucula TaxID=690887 RepID=A0A6A5Z5I4_9PLEO|nr:hypothetical protein BDV96DRAFT_632539 [Lophiotrema nucula]